MKKYKHTEYMYAYRHKYTNKEGEEELFLECSMKKLHSTLESPFICQILRDVIILYLHV